MEISKEVVDSMAQDITKVIKGYCPGDEVWLTEVAFTTTNLSIIKQVRLKSNCVEVSVERR